MFTALVLLLVLIELTPVIVFTDGTTTYGIVAVVTALALGIISTGVRTGEAGHLAKLVRLALPLLAVPALWMLVQLFPVPFGRFSHPVWASAAEALNMPISGHISIDLGATVIGLVRYLTAAGILVVATAVAIDRRRAEWLLYSLMGTTAFLAVALIVLDLLGWFPFAGPRAPATLWAASALGAIMAAAATIRSVERYETRRNRAKFVWFLSASLSALAGCWIALATAAPVGVTIAASCGFAAVGLTVTMRRFALERFAIGALATVAIIAAVAIAAATSNAGGGNPTLRFAAGASPSAVSTTERMIADNPGGTGAGTFKSLLPIYRNIDDDATVPEWAPTTAAQVMIEMGRPALWILAIIVIIATVMLLRGAASRGRDSFYAMGAAGCAITLTVEAFVDDSLTTTAIVILAMAVLGLGLAQSASRTVQ